VLYQDDEYSVQTVIDWLQASSSRSDQLSVIKLRKAVVAEILANLKFRKGETHVGDWLASAHRAAALLRVFCGNPPHGLCPR
jgi:hypothetical protein